MTQEEKAQAQDVLDGLLRDAYQRGYKQGFEDGVSTESHKKVVPSQETATAPKICADCTHSSRAWGSYVCNKMSTEQIDIITGLSNREGVVDCSNARRTGGHCGPEGLLFEKREVDVNLVETKESWIKRLGKYTKILIRGLSQS